MFESQAGQQAGRKAAARITRFGLLLAFIASAVPLIGWMAHLPVLAGLGFATLPMLPLTSIGFLCSIVALAGATWGSPKRFVLPLLLLALAIGGISLLEIVTGFRAGIDGILSAQALQSAPAELNGRAGVLSQTMLLLLPIIIVLADSRKVVAGRIAAVLASLCLAFGALSLLLVPNADHIGDSDLRYLTVSLGSGIAITGLSIALLARLGEAGWSRVLAIRSPEWRLFEVIFPIILIMPVFVEAFEFLALSGGLLSPVMAQIAGAGLDVAAIATVLFWATSAIVQQRAALQELTGALGAAPIALTDRAGRIIHWSRGCEDLFGWSAAEAVGQLKHQLVASQAADPSDTRDPSNYVTGSARGLIETTRGGDLVRVIEQVRSVTGPGRRPMLVLSITDIGARLDAEAALLESQERLSLALSSHDVGIFEWRAPDPTIRWSPGSEERFGLEPGDFSSYKRWKTFVEPNDVLPIIAAFKETASQRRERLSFKYRFHSRSGTLRTVDGSARCFYDAGGRLVRIVGVSIDVTAREEREAALQAREAQLRSILETVPDAMVVIDAQGTISSFSRTAEEMFGYSAAHAVGMNVSVLTTGDHAGRHDDYLRRYHRTGERRVIGRERLLTAVAADGREIPVELRVGEAKVGSEQLFTGFIRDVSQRLHAEERLSTLQADLAHVSRTNAMGELAAGLAHELNQPLTSIVNFLGTADFVLKRGGDPMPAEAAIKSASEQAMRAGEIIRRLRAFIAKREAETRREPVEPAVREAAALVLVGQDQFDVRLHLDFDPAAGIMLADRIQIQQVMVNLMRNSVEAMRVMPRDNREVCVRTNAVDNGMLEISVSDSGPGIPTSVLARMFQPFTSTKGEGGLGIGLSICRRIVQAHGGTLQAENMPDGGACFRFTIPRITGEELPT